MILLQVNSETLFLIAITVAMLLGIGFFSIYLVFLFQKRKARLIEQQRVLKEIYEKEILQTQIEIRDQTMKDVGNELHDNIGQVLTLIKLTLAQVRVVENDMVNKERLLSAKSMVGDVINDLRSLSKTLNGDLIMQAGLVESISHELKRINKLDITNCQLQIQGEPYVMPVEKEFVVFRIIQENLNNILKHSKSRNVMTILTYEPDIFTLTQKDDGIGCDLETILKRKIEAGNGITNMKRRCELIKANFFINSWPNEGTEITMKIAI